MPIRVGVIGLEYGAQVHVPAFKENPSYELVAVCSRPAERVEQYARENNISRWYADPRELINSDVDLVSIATPPASHAGLVAAALARKRHVITEIAFMPTAADARVVTDMAHAAGVVSATAFVLRYKPALRYVSELLRQGEIGEPRLLCFDYFSNVLALSEQNPRWMWDADNGGGVLAGYISHAIDVCEQWFGPAREVNGTLATLTSIPVPSGISHVADDTGHFSVQFENGLLGLFRYSGITAVPRTGFEIHGTTGTLLIDGFGDDLAILRMGADATEPLYVPMHYIEELRGHGGLQGAFNVFLERLAAAITENGSAPDLPTFAAGLRVTRVVDAMRRSAQEKRAVAVAEI